MLFLNIENTGKKEFAKFFVHDLAITDPTKQVVVTSLGSKTILLVIRKDAKIFEKGCGEYVQASIGYKTASGVQKFTLTTLADFASDLARTMEVWEVK